jgi:NAD-dependent SIR2 family protein deacetylase
MNPLAEITEILAQARNVLVITGAGVSTDSGIGDYRDDQGLWKRGEPITHQKFVQELAWRQRYWARSQLGFPEFYNAQPNQSHKLLAELERHGKTHTLVTQNVDGLHQKAGQKVVIDLHGRLDEVVCLSCGERRLRQDVQTWLEATNTEVGDDFYSIAPDGDADIVRQDFSNVRVPQCSCGGLLKPNVVFFGDNVPRQIVDEAYRWVDEADAVLVIGSSLMVYSSFRFVRRGHQQGIPIVAINRGKTRADELFTAKIEGDCAHWLDRLSSKLAY